MSTMTYKDKKWPIELEPVNIEWQAQKLDKEAFIRFISETGVRVGLIAALVVISLIM